MVCPRTFLDMQNRIILFSYRLSLKKSCEWHQLEDVLGSKASVNLVGVAYISLRVDDYMKDMQSIDRAIKKLLSHPTLIHKVMALNGTWMEKM